MVRVTPLCVVQFLVVATATFVLFRTSFFGVLDVSVDIKKRHGVTAYIFSPFFAIFQQIIYLRQSITTLFQTMKQRTCLDRPPSPMRYACIHHPPFFPAMTAHTSVSPSRTFSL